MVMLFPSPATAALLVLVVVLLQLQLWSAEAQVAVGSGPPAGCPAPDRCGNVSVPFPFGIRTGCSLEGFGLTCNTTSNPPRLMIGNSTLQVVSISLANSTLRAVDIAGAVNITYGYGEINGNGTWGGVAATSTSPYIVSETLNQLLVTGCNIQAILLGSGGNIITGCSSFCSIDDKDTGDMFRSPGNKCASIGCCQQQVSIGRPSYRVVLLTNLDETREFSGRVPEAVRISELGWFDGLAADLLNESLADTSLRKPVPVVLEWAVASTARQNKQAPNNWSCPTAGEARRSACTSSNSKCVNVTDNYRSGYVCQCEDGYTGNPYVPGGCQCINIPGSFLCQCPPGATSDRCVVKSKLGLIIGVGIGSGAGLFIMALGAVFLALKANKRRARMRRQVLQAEPRPFVGTIGISKG
ncbi:hypothetical protein OsI_32396 [Oryza sativa Indica Group]|uniref:Wall-associated receptor kinase galacturonan-binding domain-containing protein n=1 Tax=Oryza sativa subsp. indica TaxID=39946 RepID=A2Z426_ORYSI|nr:hypothetical protein OsI_32396 [Oryza sativa Indica Group]